MMHRALPLFFVALAYAARLSMVFKLWAPRLNQPSPIRQYRAAVLTWLFIDAPVVLWLAATGRYPALVGVQFIALVLAQVANNLTLAHFANRSATPAVSAAKAVQLSMTPRRLRDHTNPLVELSIAAVLLASLVLVARAHAFSAGPWLAWDAPRWLRSIDSVSAWVLYLQLGLLLLKLVFVRWRMPLPLRRTDDFRRWRTAWLSYHLRLFDALRVLLALAMLSLIVWLTRSPQSTTILALAWLAILAVFAAYVTHNQRSLNAVANQLRPADLVKEFPPRTIPEGRFLAGVFYINRQNPGVLVPSGRGIALNVSHPATYGWTAYLAGLVALVTWVTR
jgi:hypothetical protein